MKRASHNTWTCVWHGMEYVEYLHAELRAGLAAIMLEALYEETGLVIRA